MSKLDRDFMGVYDWPAEEANILAEQYINLVSEGEEMDYIHKLIIKDREHWVKVFGSDEQGKADMKRFSEVFNSKVFKLTGLAI